jgi:hypothetical protein
MTEKETRGYYESRKMSSARALTPTQLEVNVGQAAGRDIREQHHRLLVPGVGALFQSQQRRHREQIGECVAHRVFDL